MSRFTLQRSSRRAVLRLLRWCLLCAALFGLSGVCDIGAYAAVAMPGMSATRTASSSAHPAAGAPASATISLTPQEAKQALDVLNDPRRRAQIEDTLRAVAAAGALAAPPAAAASAPAASSASAASAAAPASAAASTIRNAFTSNGLVAQLVRHGAQALNGVGQDLRRSVATLLDLSSVRSWWSVRLTDPQQRAALLHLAFVVFGTLVPALLIEWLTRRSLRRPRFAVAARGMEGQPEDAAHDGVQAQAAASGDAAGNVAGDATSNATSDAANAVRPAVSAEDAEASAAAGVKVEAQADAAAARTEATAQEQSRAEATPEAPTTLTGVIASHLNWSASVHHWTLLRRLPSALLFTLLEIVPLIAFVAVSGLLASLLTDDGTPADLMLGSLIDVYVFCRAVEIVSAFFLAPSCPRLRLLRMRDRWAVFLQRWVLAIVCVSGAGVALANAAQPIGLTDAAHLAILKAVTFVGHLLIAIMILQCRVPVAARLRSRSGGSGALALFGNWVADVWAIVAVFVVMALWFVWALDVRNGYRTLIHLGGLSLVILICARVAAIVAFGALGRVFQQDDKTPPSIVRKRAARYYPLMRRTVSTAIAVVTLFVLLEVWGLHISQAFAADAVGHRLLSAVVTIVVAAAVALFVWEAVNAAAERKLDVWTTGGDYVRAARLRTLLPMLRTALFVVIALVVVLTGLSELGVNTAPLLAGASIFGVALGFGSQKLVQDFITGIFLLMENAMQVGDWVTLAGVSGTVEYLSIRTVRLRGGDGSLYTVPFSSVSTVNNTNRGIGNAAVKVVIAFGQDVELAAATLKEIGASLREDDAFRAGILNDFAYWGVDQVDGAGVTLVGQIQCKDSARWGVQREFNRRVFARFRERGIELLNPQRNNVLIAPGSVSRFGRDDVEDVDDHEAHDDRGATRGRGDDDDGGPGGAGNGNGNGNGGKSGKGRDGDRDPRPPSRRTN